MRYVSLSMLIILCALASCTAVAPPMEAPAGTIPSTTPAATMAITTTDSLTATVVMTTPPPTVTQPITAPVASEVGSCVWSATHDLQPPGPAQLRVTGVCTMPTPGYTLTLTRAEPQGINPTHLLLNLTIAEPTDMVAQVLAPAEVVYEETTEQSFEQADILSQSDLVEGTSVAVEEVN